MTELELERKARQGYIDELVRMRDELIAISNRLHRIEEAARKVTAERDTYAAGSTMDRLRAALEEK